MEIFLLIIVSAALVYLWRRIEALAAQLRHFETVIEEQHQQNSRGDTEHLSEPHRPETPARTEPAAPKPAPNPASASFIPTARSLSDAAAAAGKLSSETSEKFSTHPARAAASQAATEAVTQDPIKTPGKPYLQINFEDIFGRLLPIWAGGIALAVSGFFLVRYSIDQGLLAPHIRVAFSFIFGALLLGGAEAAFRQEHRLADPRVRQALSGAGLATLYASFYLAGSHYGLVGSAVAFLGMAGVTAGAVVLSFRFGLPCAILGLVGGFAAPMLVDSQEPNLPMLAVYLALVTGGLTYAGNRQGRSWLALAALAGGLGWGAMMLLTGLTNFSDILAVGGYLVVIGAVLPAFTHGRDAPVWVRIGAAGLTALQIGIIVTEAGFSILSWGLYGLLAATLSFFAWTEARLRDAAAFVAGLAIVMLGLWTGPDIGSFIAVGVAFTAICVGVPMANIWRGQQRAIDTMQIAGFSLGLIVVASLHFTGPGRDSLLALVCLGISILPALAAWLLWPPQDKAAPISVLSAVASTAIGTAIAGLIVTPLWAAPAIIAGVALGLVVISWTKITDRGLHVLIWLGAACVIIALIVTPNFLDECALLFGVAEQNDLLRSSVRWTAASSVFLALAWRYTSAIMTSLAEVLSALLLYGLAAQCIPEDGLAWIVAVAAVFLAYLQPERWAGRMTLIAVTFGWALWPLLTWTDEALYAVSGGPMLIAGDISLHIILSQFIPLLVAAATMLQAIPEKFAGRHREFAAILGTVILIGLHMMYKHIFGLSDGFGLGDGSDFITYGTAERTVWQAFLLGSGWTISTVFAEKAFSKQASIALYTAALAHFTYFSWLLHNPLWAEQAVGGWPIVNMLLPLYGAGIGAVWLLQRAVPAGGVVKPWMFSAMSMLFIASFTLSELRHAFTGSLMSGNPILQTEGLLISLLAILLAIGFLFWGARKNHKSWRIGSLVLIVLAVIKVFIFDTADLEGLARVGSFMALGFSLIGIGWFYTRQLGGSPTGNTDPAQV